MQNVRLFIGSHLNSESFIENYNLIQKDFSAVCYGKWVEAENLHLTYHFIGEVSKPEADKIKIALSDCLGEYQTKLVLSGLGAFPKLKNPRVLFANIINSDGTLREIYNQTKEILGRFNYHEDKESFKPHLTLVRIKDLKQREFADLIASYKDYHFASFETVRVELIQSTLTPKGPIYNLY